MTQEKQEAPPQTAPGFKLAPPRAAVKTGMPTDGFWLFAGLPKAGKTTLGASAPGAVLLEMERGGADRINGWVQEIPDLPTFRQALFVSMRDPSVKAIVIDTLDMLLDWIGDDVAEQFGLDNLNERKEGVNGFAVSEELRKRVNGLIGTFKGCGKLVLALAHLREPKLDNEGKLVISHNINARGKLAGYICGQADVIGNCFKRPVGQDTQYVVSFQGGGMLGTFGGRISELEGRTIILPKTDQWAAITGIFDAKAPTAGPAKDEKTAAAKTKGGK